MALSVDDIAALTDAEIDRCPDGPFKLPVDGWDKLSKDECNRLAERLKRASFDPFRASSMLMETH